MEPNEGAIPLAYIVIASVSLAIIIGMPLTRAILERQRMKHLLLAPKSTENQIKELKLEIQILRRQNRRSNTILHLAFLIVGIALLPSLLESLDKWKNAASALKDNPPPAQAVVTMPLPNGDGPRHDGFIPRKQPPQARRIAELKL